MRRTATTRALNKNQFSTAATRIETSGAIQIQRGFSSSMVTRALAKVKVSAETDRARTDARDEPAKRHTFVFDEPAKLGGADTGPTPLEGVLGCLAGCENATAKAIAKRMGWKFNKLRFQIEGTWDNSAFFGPSDIPTRFQTIDVVIDVEAPELLPEPKFKEFIEVVEKTCPVANLVQAAGVKLNSTWTQKRV